ncbi:SigB/SigF/SigG family RNA polymerase sigma factor [Streptomyces sp. JJ38]|uniref:SigB/SigF/SigG family RNA polymerase sigma factor n=1 Tax=Streptomyces sp. JJ38 TaxID=2738128 RepID=UPI001C5995C8|nr:SigB/SigF/SigG family RNA polymerase sigma factor [Streptomyces sp. JJ38]MBW1599453.1 SigB/SigF/SigG family RNA polymerase sigma factor [Streptomyces sp. JJ38]
MSTVVSRSKRTRHPHDDAPDTAGDLERLATLPDGPEREHLQQEIVRAWMPMAYRLAYRYRNRSESLEDLQQVAALGLVKAVDRYDPARGCAFESYAVPTIVGELRRHFRDNLWDLHVPRRVQELRNKVRASRRELGLTLDRRSPTVAQIAEHSGLSEEDVQLGMEALESYRTLSLDSPYPHVEDAFTRADTLGDFDAGYDRVIYRESVKPRLRRLPERERRILYLRFFCDMSQSRIAAEVGISQMHVSRLISSTCRRIRREVEAETAAVSADEAPTPAHDRHR